MDTVEVKTNLYNLIGKTKDIDILHAITVLLEKHYQTNNKWNYYEDINTENEITEEHKKILDERYKSYKKNPQDLISWEKVKEIIKK